MCSYLYRVFNCSVACRVLLLLKVRPSAGKDMACWVNISLGANHDIVYGIVFGHGHPVAQQ